MVNTTSFAYLVMSSECPPPIITVIFQDGYIQFDWLADDDDGGYGCLSKTLNITCITLGIKAIALACRLM
eukprot:3412840-Amphidinium_carterae.1